MPVTDAAKLRAIIDCTGAGTWEYNLDSEELLINDRWARMLGYELSELEQISFAMWERLTHPVDLENAKSVLMDVINGTSEFYDCIIRMRHKDNSWRYIHTRGGLYVDHQSRWIVGMHMDLTEEKQAQHRLEKLAESLPGVIYTFGMRPDGTYYFPYISAKTTEYFGVEPEIAMNDPETVFNSIHPDDIENLRMTITQSYETLSEWTCDYRVQMGNGWSWVRGVSLPERDDDGIVTWHGLVSNIDIQKQMEMELADLATIDELTKVFNRRFMMSRIEACVAEYARYGLPFSLGYIDIDHFKAVNDSHGHLVGDGVLRKFAEIFSDRIRNTDTFARAGGEEFLLLMPHTSITDAGILLENIRGTLESYEFESMDGTKFHISISAGVIGCENIVSPNVTDLLHDCDQALYQAKKDGRNRIVLKKI